MDDFRRFRHGASLLVEGFRTWRTRPRLMLLGVVPAVLTLFVLVIAFALLLAFGDDLIAWATPFADDWSTVWRRTLRIGLLLAVLGGGLFLSIVTFTALTLAIGDPFYEKIWMETERSLGGDVPDKGVPWLKAVVDSLPLIAIGVITTISVFLLSLIPVIGPIIGFVVGLVVAGRALAGELVSRSLEARGMRRRARKEFLAPYKPEMFGFGVAVQVCCLIPFGAVLMMPAGVVGSTLLAREMLDRTAERQREALGPVGAVPGEVLPAAE